MNMSPLCALATPAPSRTKRVTNPQVNFRRAKKSTSRVFICVSCKESNYFPNDEKAAPSERRPSTLDYHSLRLFVTLRQGFREEQVAVEEGPRSCPPRTLTRQS